MLKTKGREEREQQNTQNSLTRDEKSKTKKVCECDVQCRFLNPLYAFLLANEEHNKIKQNIIWRKETREREREGICGLKEEEEEDGEEKVGDVWCVITSWFIVCCYCLRCWSYQNQGLVFCPSQYFLGFIFSSSA